MQPALKYQDIPEDTPKTPIQDSSKSSFHHLVHHVCISHVPNTPTYPPPLLHSVIKSYIRHVPNILAYQPPCFVSSSHYPDIPITWIAPCRDGAWIAIYRHIIRSRRSNQDPGTTKRPAPRGTAWLGPGQARPAEGAQGKSECRAARHEQAWHTLSPVPHVGAI
jgi:hypothetical protein